MKFNKTIIICILPLCTLSYAGSEIFKCTNPDGFVSYANEKPSDKNIKCVKTNLGHVDPGTILNKEAGKPLSVKINNELTSEQIAREEKRILILRKELAQEEESFSTTSKMLNNLQNSKDTDQINKLKELVSKHQRNIEAINKEINGNKITNINLEMLKSVDGPKPPQSLPQAVNQINSTSSTIILKGSKKELNPIIKNIPSLPKDNSASKPKIQDSKSLQTKPIPITKPQTKEIQPQKNENTKEISPMDFLLNK